MNCIIVLTIPFQFGDTKDQIHPVVLADSTNLVLIDCGYLGFLPKLEGALAEQGLSCSQLSHVVITHHDHDHMGALADLKRRYPKILVVAGEKEAPYISGERKFLRLEQAEAMQTALPPEQQTFGLEFCRLLERIKPVPVDLMVREGDRLPWCGGCTILETPGHTPGHISLYINEAKTLIAGDAAVLEGGRLALANPQFALNLEEARRSLDRITALGAKEIICYHGGVFCP